MNQHTALAVGIRSVVLHEVCGSLVAKETADQVDMHDLGEEVTVHRATLAQHPASAHHTSAIDEQVDTTHPGGRRLHCGVDFRLRRDIAPKEAGIGPQLCGCRLPRAFLHVEHDDLATLCNNMAGNCRAQTGGATGNYGASFLDLHYDSLD